MIPYSFHPEAESELAEAVSFYELRLSGLGIALAVEVERIISLLRDHTEAGSPYGPGCRSLMLSRFPYRLVYRMTTAGLLVVAVAHLHRRPGYWRRRE